MPRLPAAVAASTCAAWNWAGLQMAHNIDLRILERGLYAGSRPRRGPAGHQGAHSGVDIHNMHDLQPVAKGREGGR
jgi:hypothetical protein